MSTFDLKPLSPENIEDMSFNKDTLWLIELDGAEYGPFETESLKHYASENKEIMEEALARRLDQDEYKEFWTHPQFQRRKMQVINVAEDQDQYWITYKGLKTGPLTFKEVDKQIEMNLLSMTDLVSMDNGESWIQIHEITNFDRRSHHPNDLPAAPSESHFQAAKLQVIGDLENKTKHATDELADLVYEIQHKAKVIPFRSEEIALRNTPSTSKPKKKWIVPAAVAVLGVIFLTSDFSSEVGAPESVDQAMTSFTKRAPGNSAMAKQQAKPKHKAYSPPSTYDRSPASIRPQPSIERIDNSPRYPTIVESHEDDYGTNVDYPQDRPDEPYIEAEAGPKEYSLVGNDTYAPQTLDAAMNGDTNEAIVEEVSDF